MGSNVTGLFEFARILVYPPNGRRQGERPHTLIDLVDMCQVCACTLMAAVFFTGKLLWPPFS